MLYLSTRGGDPVTSAQAIVRGIALDGGLYVPSALPRLTYAQIRELFPLSYDKRAARIMALLLPDFSLGELEAICAKAYARFDPEPAPLKVLGNTAVLELFHGPTMAFKDMALQVLPYLMRSAAEKTGETREIAILTATSGDTGKAALEGFSDVEGTSVTVFYPDGGVSAIQETQMLTSAGKNTCVIAVKGNFDDAQNGVKALFLDAEFKKAMAARGKVLSSANSINLGRLVPQVAYYFSAVIDMIKMGMADEEHPVAVCVPTGNFGNILAAWYACRMGAPIGKLICASNANDVLTTFIASGRYDRRLPFMKTLSPSMDILISSNLERFLWELGGTKDTIAWMEQLKKDGLYSLNDDQLAYLRSRFTGGCADDDVTMKEIGRVWNEYRYVMDPHTAVASAVLNGLDEAACGCPRLLVSTASPYKFGEAVCGALGITAPKGDAFAAADLLNAHTGLDIPGPFRQLKEARARDRIVVEKEAMGRTILEQLR